MIAHPFALSGPHRLSPRLGVVSPDEVFGRCARIGTIVSRRRDRRRSPHDLVISSPGTSCHI
jgi:hypothetical protein